VCERKKDEIGALEHAASQARQASKARPTNVIIEEGSKRAWKNLKYSEKDKKSVFHLLSQVRLLSNVAAKI